MSNEQDVQEKRLNAMKYKILKTEQENLKREKRPQIKWWRQFGASSWMKRKRIIEVTGYAD